MTRRRASSLRPGDRIRWANIGGTVTHVGREQPGWIDVDIELDDGRLHIGGYWAWTSVVSEAAA